MQGFNKCVLFLNINILILLTYISFLNPYSKNFKNKIFFSGNTHDTDRIEFLNNSNYRYLKNTANWHDS